MREKEQYSFVTMILRDGCLSLSLSLAFSLSFSLSLLCSLCLIFFSLHLLSFSLSLPLSLALCVALSFALFLFFLTCSPDLLGPSPLLCLSPSPPPSLSALLFLSLAHFPSERQSKMSSEIVMVLKSLKRRDRLCLIALSLYAKEISFNFSQRFVSTSLGEFFEFL